MASHFGTLRHVSVAHRSALPSLPLFRAQLSGPQVARQSDGTKVMRPQGGVQVCGWTHTWLKTAQVASHLWFFPLIKAAEVTGFTGREHVLGQSSSSLGPSLVPDRPAPVPMSDIPQSLARKVGVCGVNQAHGLLSVSWQGIKRRQRVSTWPGL